MSPRLQRLSQEKWELAFRVVDQAWKGTDEPLVSFSPPKSLRHLRREDWEEICQCLLVLQHQKEHSPIH